MAHSLNSDIDFEKMVIRDHLKNVSSISLLPEFHQNVTFTHNGFAWSGLRPIHCTFFKQISRKRYRKLILYSIYKRIREKKIRPAETVCLVHHFWSNGYHHWICESLLKACYLDAEKDVLYLPEEYPAFAKESLELMGFKKIKLIPSGTGIKCDNAKIIPNPISGLLNNVDLAMIRSRFAKQLNDITNTNQKIFISRKSNSLRTIVNEEELILELIKRNYRIIESEKLSFIDQIKLYSSTKVLLSVHGAGLTNCLFMPPDSIIFELYRKMDSENDYMNLCYYRMSKSLNQRYLIQFCEYSEDGRLVEKDRKNISVDLELFIHNLDLIEQTLKKAIY